MQIMSFFDLISSRHSVRAFKEHKMPNEIIEKILTAATRAASAGNLQSYQIFVVSKKRTKKTRGSCTRAKFYRKCINCFCLLCGSSYFCKRIWQKRRRALLYSRCHNCLLVCTACRSFLGIFLCLGGFFYRE